MEIFLSTGQHCFAYKDKGGGMEEGSQ